MTKGPCRMAGPFSFVLPKGFGMRQFGFPVCQVKKFAYSQLNNNTVGAAAK
jgi:hypothetical protein